MLQLIAAALAVYIWVENARDFALFLCGNAPAEYAQTLYRFGGIIFAGVLIAALLLLGALTEGWGRKRWSDAIWVSGPGRRLIGMAAGATLFSALVVADIALLRVAMGDGLATVLLGTVAALPLRRPVKIILGRSTRPLRWLLAGRHAGMGGTARFSGLLDEWANPWQPGHILLGRSKYDPKWLVGMHDDRHLCTLATSRSGKGRSVIIPALLQWLGSALIIDIKGQNAYVTARARHKKLGQTVRILDPLGEIQDPELRKYVARFNPLAELDPAAADYAERVAAIADALVVPDTEGKDAFFDNASRQLIAGLIDYVMMSPQVGNDERNLATMRGILIHPDGLPIEEMETMGGMAQAAAAGLKEGGDNSTGDVKYTAMTHTGWLDSKGMQNALAASDFSLLDLNKGNTTIYLVLPPKYIDIHGRFLRLFVNMAIQSASDGRKGKHATLFLLDEFYALGRLQLLAKAAGLLAGYGLKLWPIIQNIGQLQELYPRNWETFLGNAGIWTVFAMNDASTAKYLSERLGVRILWRKMRGPKGFEWEISGTAPLRDAYELRKDTSRRSETAAIFTESGEAFLLGRANYDALFNDDEYAADPFENGAQP